ncbi:hemerythrin domain-containing protein [Actinoplanes sp. N902-109]|uniref:hemerythrin domain-containing protein n=1 Tax=Actinoplanes sp. (strain N902-109) TaxID=649831 RepID=UPI0003295ADD|nr:hemerythrin domain-containing protein [Actinoplanes sp. N902-109]AGL18637.1 hemerythrin hhe cation binding domain-containing protein [Actinoplanes sp. N902-109]
MSTILPPLPPVGGETTGPNVVDVIARQHRELIKLAGRYAADGDAKTAQVVVASVARHLSAEEQYLYPAVRAIVPGGDELVERELAEDRALLEACRLLEGTDGQDLLARLHRHAEAAQAELAPLLLQLASVEDLIRLGNRFELAQEAAPTRPHPGTPVTPPWNKVVDPAVAIVDKVRDAVSRRATYPKDL